MTKKLFPIFFISIFIFSCKPEHQADDSIEVKKTLLSEKKQALKSLQDEIDLLISEIAALDPAQSKQAVNVTAAILDAKEFNRYVDLQAIVQSDDLVNAGSELGGRIVKLTVKEGQIVKKGQLIATIDAESIEKQKDELSKSLDLANEIYERQKRLWDQNIGSEVQFLQAKNNKERIEKSMQTIDAQLRKKNVYAPLSGAVDKVFLKEGEMTAPGTPIVQILNINKIKVTADVPENYLGKIKIGDQVLITFPALGKELTQKVSMIGRTIDPSNRTFKLEMNLDNSKGELKPNLLAIVKINDYTIKNVITIPVDLVQQEVNGNKYVFIVKNENDKNYAHKTYITTGESADGRVVIQSGLNKGDQLIIKGARNVTESVEINIATE